MVSETGLKSELEFDTANEENGGRRSRDRMLPWKTSAERQWNGFELELGLRLEVGNVFKVRAEDGNEGCAPPPCEEQMEMEAV